jgi:hypothetical protein
MFGHRRNCETGRPINHIFAAGGARKRATRRVAAQWGNVMRWTIAAAALLVAAPLAAEDVIIDSAVYRETARAGGVREVAPARALLRGDRVVTILRWEAPRGASYTAVSTVPAGLAVESASRPGLEVSIDGGRSWRRLSDPDAVPPGTTHLRWLIGGGEGRLSYRAVVR